MNHRAVPAAIIDGKHVHHALSLLPAACPAMRAGAASICAGFPTSALRLTKGAAGMVRVRAAVTPIVGRTAFANAFAPRPARFNALADR